MTATEEPAARSVIGIGIAASALEEGGSDAALRRAVHEDVIEALSVHGTLVFTSTEQLARFVATVRTLPSSLAKAWETVLSSKRVKVQIRDPEQERGLSEVLDPAELDSRLAPDIQLVLLEADQAELLGVPDDEFSARTPSGLVEIGRINTAGRTTALLAARSVLEAPLREGVNREVEWAQRFEPLAASASPIVVYDKFVGQQVIRRYIYDQAHSGDGLTWFLGRVSMKPGRRVRVITSVTDFIDRGRRFDEGTAARAFDLLMLPMWERQLRLDLVLVPERTRAAAGQAASKFGHDRHIRFGDRAALALGVGLQAFAQGTLTETTTVARLPIADARAREERAVKAALRPPEQGWLARPLRV